MKPPESNYVRCICGGERRCGYCTGKWCMRCGKTVDGGRVHRCREPGTVPPAAPPPRPKVIELTHATPFGATPWTEKWERELRHANWVERDGLFYPRVVPASGRRRLLG